MDARSLTFGLLLIGAAPLAAQSDCQPVFDARDKVMNTPTHIYSTATPSSGGKGQTTEMIYVSEAIYANVKGKWSLSPVTPVQVMKQEQENRKTGKHSCVFQKDELVDGELLSLYKIHEESDDQKSDGQISISKSTGLPVRNEIDIESKSGRDHYSVRYDYKHVVPPKL